MKGKKTLLSIVSAVALIASIFLPACKISDQPTDQNSDADSAQSYVQSLDYSESVEKINNPDQGFYRPIYVTLTQSGAKYNKYIVNESTQLYHLRIDISEFSSAVNGVADRALSDEALKGFDELLSYIEEKDKSAIVRFAYDPAFGGHKDKEPTLQTMLSHVAQICPVINRHEATVTAVEVGLVGPWGEMHSSAAANANVITPLTDAFLSNTNLPVLVRTPKMIYNYLGITINDIDGYKIEESDRAYRLGLYNDGYLGSSTDLGTYTDRQCEVGFLSAQTDHLPYGGEVVVPESNLHDIDKCLTEMYQLNLSYLNVEWNDKVIKKWKETYYTNECGEDELYYGKTAFDYIQNRLGYRLILDRSVFKYSQDCDSLQIELTIKNVGFGNLNRKKRSKLIFTDNDGKTVYSRNVNDFSGEGNFNCKLDLNLDDGEYSVYLCVYGEEIDGVPMHCVRFANDGLWNSELKANKIGRLNKTTVSE